MCTTKKSPVGDPRQIAKLQELDAQIALGQQLGEIPPAPEPWSIQRAAKERLAFEHPPGDPAASPMSEMLVEHLKSKFDALAKLSDREQGNMAGAVAEDFGYTASAVSLKHSSYRRETGTTPTGPEIVNALIQDAQPALDAIAEPGKRHEMAKLLRLDRQLLELLAVRGRNMSSYSARKRELGL